MEGTRGCVRAAYRCSTATRNGETLWDSLSTNAPGVPDDRRIPLIRRMLARKNPPRHDILRVTGRDDGRPRT